jgi:hypothetical protein
MKFRLINIAISKRISFVASLKKGKLLLTSLAICVSCNAQKETEFTSQTLNLKGNIKHIVEKTGDVSWELEFRDNKLLSVVNGFSGAQNGDSYRLQYKDNKLIQIYSGSSVISPEIFSSNLEMRQPLNGYHGADSLVRNDLGDVVQVLFKATTPNKYRIGYTYDRFNNWITREVFITQTNSLIERTERTIIYDREVNSYEIDSWNAKLDSIYTVAKERNQLIASIDETIEKNNPKLKELDNHLNKWYDDVIATDAAMIVLMNKFTTEYGHANLPIELDHIKDKLRILQGITQRESSLWREAKYYVPLLIKGKKSVKDVQEPFTSRYTLTYSLELIDEIKKLEKEYALK